MNTLLLIIEYTLEQTYNADTDTNAYIGSAAQVIANLFALSSYRLKKPPEKSNALANKLTHSNFYTFV